VLHPAYSDRPGRGRREINVATSNERPAIINSYGDAATAAYANPCSESKRFVCGGKSGAIKALTISRPRAAEAVASPVDAGDSRPTGDSRPIRPIRPRTNAPREEKKEGKE